MNTQEKAPRKKAPRSQLRLLLISISCTVAVSFTLVGQNWNWALGGLFIVLCACGFLACLNSSQHLDNIALFSAVFIYAFTSLCMIADTPEDTVPIIGILTFAVWGTILFSLIFYILIILYLRGEEKEAG